MFLLHFLRFFYGPTGAPWYQGAVWGNIVAVTIMVPLGWLWSRTKFWPLNLVHGKLDQIIVHHERAHEHHEWVARRIAELYEARFDRPPDKHPHFEIGEHRGEPRAP